tara:strand:+ start:265 stop:678 length:414 start_codon:yes stop_codon:yes gene_type:complete
LIEFVLKGDPIALKRHRSTRTGRMYDPSAKDKKQIWLQIAKYKPKQPLNGDVFIQLIFVLKRPKSHYRTGKYKHLLKDNLPEYHSFKPDLDNLVKMILDCISGKDKMIVDDCQVCRIQAEKVYGKNGRTEIYIQEIS